jgi:hypothetical protein
MCKTKNVHNFSQFLGVMLASQMEPFLFLIMMLTYGLANIQIRMPFQLAFFIMNASLPESVTNLNCQKGLFDQDGYRAETMLLDVALCLTQKTNYGFFSH